MGVFLHDARQDARTDLRPRLRLLRRGATGRPHRPSASRCSPRRWRRCPDLTGEPFPRELLMRLKHMILSHHGTLEYGSPKVPMTPEAMLLHLIDMMDTRMHMVLRELKEDRNNQTAWTPWSPANGRRIYKGGEFGDLGVDEELADEFPKLASGLRKSNSQRLDIQSSTSEVPKLTSEVLSRQPAARRRQVFASGCFASCSSQSFCAVAMASGPSRAFPSIAVSSAVSGPRRPKTGLTIAMPAFLRRASASAQSRAASKP